jgi:alpha-L-rhamnosyl-(1->4)-beta-D-glucuronate lyase
VRSTKHRVAFDRLLTCPGSWTKSPIDPGDINGPDLYDPRGKFASDARGEWLIALLPDLAALETRIYAASEAKNFKDWKLLGVIENTSTEPLFDQRRLKNEGVLSVFVRQGGGFPDRKLQVWDFELAIPGQKCKRDARG